MIGCEFNCELFVLGGRGRDSQFSTAFFLGLKITYQVLPSDLFGMVKWPFQRLSDLHLGYQKVTWKKLVPCIFGDWLRFPLGVGSWWCWTKWPKRQVGTWSSGLGERFGLGNSAIVTCLGWWKRDLFQVVFVTNPTFGDEVGSLWITWDVFFLILCSSMVRGNVEMFNLWLTRFCYSWVSVTAT